MKLSCVSDFKILESYKADWDRIIQESDRLNIFNSYAFITSWWASFPANKQLAVFTIIDGNNRLRFAAPCYKEESQPEKLYFIGNTRGDYNNFIFGDKDYQLLNFFFKNLKSIGGWQSIYFSRIPEGTEFFRHLPNSYRPADSLLKKIICKLNFFSPVVYVSEHKNHPFVSHSDLRKSNKFFRSYNYRRQIKKISKLGRLKFQTLCDPEQILELLSAFMELQTKDALATGKNTLFAEEENQNFYRTLTKNLSRKNLRLNMMMLNEKIIAAHFGFFSPPDYYYYKPCFDPDYSTYRPGKLILAYIFNQALIEKCRNLDLLNGLEPYKQRYATGIRTTLSLTVFRSGFFRAPSPLKKN